MPRGYFWESAVATVGARRALSYESIPIVDLPENTADESGSFLLLLNFMNSSRMYIDCHLSGGVGCVIDRLYLYIYWSIQNEGKFNVVLI